MKSLLELLSSLSLKKRRAGGPATQQKRRRKKKSYRAKQPPLAFTKSDWLVEWLGLPRLPAWCAVCSSSLRSINQLSFHKRLIDCRKEELHSLSFGWFMNWLVFVFVLFPLAEPCGAAATNPPNERKTKPISSFINRAAGASCLQSITSIHSFH